MPPPLHAAAALDISFRPIEDSDRPFLFDVYASTRAEELAPTGWPPEVKLQFLRQQFAAQHDHYQRHYPDADWLIVMRDSESVGRLYVEEWADQIRLIDIAILPPFRGFGIGSAILSDLCEWASEKSKRLSIHVEKSNPARSLYDRMGFVFAQENGAYDLLEWRPDEAAAA